MGDWNVKVRSLETPGVKDKFGLGVQNEARQRLIEFCQENVLVIKHPLSTTQEKTLHMDQMANTKIRLIMFSAAKVCVCVCIYIYSISF